MNCTCQAFLSITNSWSPPKPISIESVMPSNHLILSRPLLLPPSIFSSIRVFSNESALHIRWPKYWSFSFNISSPNEYSGLISFRMDWLDLLAVQGTSRVFSNTTVQKQQFFSAQLWRRKWQPTPVFLPGESHGRRSLVGYSPRVTKSRTQLSDFTFTSISLSAFFIVQLSHPYMTTGKTIALTRWTFVGKGMSLLFNMLSRLVITFLPRSKYLLILWLQSPSAVILEPPQNKISHCLHCFPIYFP